MKKKKPVHGSALADQVHEAYIRSCKKRGIPVFRMGGKKPKGK